MTITFVDVNSDQSLMLLATTSYFSYFSLSPIRRIVKVDKFGGIKIALLLHRSPLMVLVSSGERPGTSPRRLKLWDYQTKRLVHETAFEATIEACTINKEFIIVGTDQFIYLYKLSSMALLTKFSSQSHVFCLSSEAKSYLAYPMPGTSGVLSLFDCKDLRLVSTFTAHKNAVSNISFNSAGDMLATASVTATLIRVFQVPTGQCLYTFRHRYSDPVSFSVSVFFSSAQSAQSAVTSDQLITSLCFCMKDRYLLSASAKSGIINIYQITTDHTLLLPPPAAAIASIKRGSSSRSNSMDKKDIHIGMGIQKPNSSNGGSNHINIVKETIDDVVQKSKSGDDDNDGGSIIMHEETIYSDMVRNNDIKDENTVDSYCNIDAVTTPPDYSVNNSYTMASSSTTTTLTSSALLVSSAAAASWASLLNNNNSSRSNSINGSNKVDAADKHSSGNSFSNVLSYDMLQSATDSATVKIQQLQTLSHNLFHNGSPNSLSTANDFDNRSSSGSSSDIKTKVVSDECIIRPIMQAKVQKIVSGSSNGDTISNSGSSNDNTHFYAMLSYTSEHHRQLNSNDIDEEGDNSKDVDNNNVNRNENDKNQHHLSLVIVHAANGLYRRYNLSKYQQQRPDNHNNNTTGTTTHLVLSNLLEEEHALLQL